MKILMSHRAAAGPRAFSLVELITIIVVLAVLSGIAIPKYLNISDDARVSALATDIASITAAINAYHRDTGSWPATTWGNDAPELAPYITLSGFRTASSMPLAPDVHYYFQVGMPGGNLANGPSLIIMPINFETYDTRSFTAAESALLLRIDAKIDDGNASTGRLRNYADGSVYYHFELP